MKDQVVSSPQQISGLARSFMQSRILLTAYDLDVFSALGRDWLTSAQVAAALETDPRATDRLLNALAALGLVDKKEGRFANSPLASRFLVKGRAEYMGDLGHAVNLWQTWSTLTKAVRQGGRVAPRDESDQAKKWQENFIAAMHQRGLQEAPDLVAQLDLSRVSRILDVGGGSGVFTMALVRAKPGARAVILDLPQTLTLTRRYLDQEGLADKIDLVEGDYLKADFKTGFDLVLISAILHINSPDHNQELFKKSYRALNPGGQVVIREFIMDQDRTSPAFGAFFALNMLVGTEEGDTYRQSEIEDWL